ncbi:MAG: DUF488 family protein [Candidatus Pacebacteria bacterium]|nr:DUF488 family protein [Candidatus Paceibacterota bacterium]
MVKIKRIYEKLEEDDGYRILIDHLWPRGISKEKAKIDLWFKEISPSNELRQWFNHDPEKWLEFQKKYKEELKLKKEIVNELKEIIKKKKKVTLLYSAVDMKYNNAVALKKILGL